MFEADLAVTESERLTGGAVSIGPPELPRKKLPGSVSEGRLTASRGSSINNCKLPRRVVYQVAAINHKPSLSALFNHKE